MFIITNTGKTGEFNLSANSGILVIKRYPITPLAEAMNRTPKIVKNPPIKKSIENLPRFLIIKPKPSHADMQKLSPFKAI